MSRGDSQVQSFVAGLSAGFQILGRRSAQEDAAVVRQGSRDGVDALLAVLADGHGKKGADAAQIAVEACLDVWNDGCWHRRPFSQVAQALFRDVHQRIPFRDKTSGACLTVALVLGGILHVAWAGNAEAWAGVHLLERLTRPHEPSIHFAEADRVLAAGGAWRPCPPERCQSGSRPCHRGHGYVALRHDRTLSLEVSRAVGHPEWEPVIIPDPEIVECPIVPGMRLMVASDGAWNVLRPRMGQVSAIIINMLPEHAAPMVHEAVAQASPFDNATAVILDLERYQKTSE